MWHFEDEDHLYCGGFQLCYKGPQYLKIRVEKPSTPINFGQGNNLTGLILI